MHEFLIRFLRHMGERIFLRLGRVHYDGTLNYCK